MNPIEQLPIFVSVTVSLAILFLPCTARPRQVILPVGVPDARPNQRIPARMSTSTLNTVACRLHEKYLVVLLLAIPEHLLKQIGQLLQNPGSFVRVLM